VQFGGDLALMKYSLDEYTDEQRYYGAGQTRCNNPEHSCLRSSDEAMPLVLKIWLVLEVWAGFEAVPKPLSYDVSGGFLIL
jgi:hypothetical protein